MAGKAGRGIAASSDERLESVLKRIEHWRRTRAKRTAMPEELWAAAVSLIEDRGAYTVARALKVNYATLKLRAVEAELERHRRAPGDVSFVEVNAAELFGRPQLSESVVEMSEANGSRMTIRLGPNQPVDLVGLSRAFWRHEL